MCKDSKIHFKINWNIFSDANLKIDVKKKRKMLLETSHSGQLFNYTDEYPLDEPHAGFI